ncbi:hypothetical protein [Schleiferilactobacillus shenzhenensis]|uniref:Uncharacterized protein n=1 Tax=Schleiferilactobacillus shenzhenensis LY-73 TaxID=1231336 RepID=U4TR86_9LACO|nr:hypothetical protein [Schleiferilactobacillus shenzhenensis]ERL64022.1 hypothetical protein L248_1669 [Schleiferilactobacillus shenzhenensis LY-73]
MLVRLKNGNYVNTAYVEFIFKTGDNQWILGLNASDQDTIHVSDADVDKIVKAMRTEEQPKGD